MWPKPFSLRWLELPRRAEAAALSSPRSRRHEIRSRKRRIWWRDRERDRTFVTTPRAPEGSGMSRPRSLFTLIVAVALLLAVALSSSAPASPAAGRPSADAAKLKKCKKGLNKHRCACPKGQKLKKQGRKFKCVKPKATTPAPNTTPGGDQPAPGTGDTPAPTGDQPPAPP